MKRNVSSLFACLFLFIVSFFSCQSKSNKEIEIDSVASLSSQAKVLHKTNDDSVVKITPHSTLDSLQGIWISEKDTNVIVTIKSNRYIEIYKGENDTLVSKIIFVDTCIDDNPSYDYVSKLDKTKQSGKYLLLLAAKDTLSLCYNIDELDSKFLELVYHFRPHDFYKKE